MKETELAHCLNMGLEQSVWYFAGTLHPQTDQAAGTSWKQNNIFKSFKSSYNQFVV